MAKFYKNQSGFDGLFVKVEGTLAWVWEATSAAPSWGKNVPWEPGALEQYRLCATGTDEDFKSWLRQDERRRQKEING